MADSFHGRTLATIAATGRGKYRVGFAPDTSGFKHVPFNDLAAVAAAIDDKTAAVLLEPVQGEGGVIPADPAFLRGVRELCDAKGVLLMFDEVQCGMGRTGKMFGYQHYAGVEPDLMSLAKALGNGYPISAILARRSLGDVLTAGTHASTFGGTPLACAAALATLDAFEAENVLENCRLQGAAAMEMIGALAKKRPVIRQVRGLGLMIGVVLDCESKGLIPIARKEGLLLVGAGENVVRFYPPLTIKTPELVKAVRMLDRAVAKFMHEGQIK
jgi:acetylornithine/succinyldiaminopimelate/putrescine aminotransferase